MGDTRYSQCSYRCNGKPARRFPLARWHGRRNPVSGASAREVCEESAARDLAFLASDLSHPLSSPFRIWRLRRLCRSSKGRLKKIINILSDWLMYRKPATLRQFFLRRGLYSCQIMLEQRQHWPSLGKVVIYNSKRALPRLRVPPRFFGSVEY